MTGPHTYADYDLPDDEPDEEDVEREQAEADNYRESYADWPDDVCGPLYDGN